MKKHKQTMQQAVKPLTFPNEAAEADWWASEAGREFLKKQQPAGLKEKKGSPLVAKLNQASSDVSA